MAESRKLSQARHSAQSAGTALTAATDTSQRDNRDRSEQQREARTEYSDRGRGRGGRGRGRGRGRNGGRGRAGHGFPGNNGGTYSFGNGSNGPIPFGQHYSWQLLPTWAGPPSGSSQHQQWTNWAQVPPCPYPTMNKHSNSAAGILGPRPTQSFTANHTPTDINQAMYAMALNDPSWAMDTGATGHMTSNSKLSSSFNNSIIRNIIVGNGQTFPVHGQGDLTLPPPLPPFKLNQVLYTPSLIKNLLPVRRFTTDNQLSIV
ncbi:uncharacterized protein LOC110883421 [Helianthus annuus]|uniref:uncharacterized protein LOC110883421 n=1 Tax=Helianthus annuus TaxID=4232 RepID=UPI000B8FFA5B|nr:uncharacterized protein LOC110883421 [Helianthus annuus]